jgi:tetratricopeptide (TPR) repeat protein
MTTTKDNKATLFRIKKISLATILGLSSLGLSSIAWSQDTPALEPNITGGYSESEFIYRYLVSEVALQRHQLGTSTRIMYDLAAKTSNTTLAERATQIAVASHNVPWALQASKLWLDLNPNSEEARQTFAQMNLLSGNLKAALPYVSKLLENDETRANSFIYLNSLLANQPNPQEKLRFIQALATPYPNLPEAHLTTSNFALEAGQYSLALEEIRIANKLRPQWELGGIQESRVLASQSPTEAIAYLKGFLEAKPDAFDARLDLTKLLIQEHRYQESKQEIALLAKNSSGKPEVLAMVALLSIDSNQFKDAENYFLSALDTNIRGKNQIYYYLGMLASRQNNDLEAMKWFGRVQKSDERVIPDQLDHYLEARIMMASITLKTEGVDKAIAVLDEMENLDNQELIRVIITESHLLNDAKRLKEANQLLDHAQKNFPDSPELLYEYAITADGLKQYTAMEKALRHAIEIKPDFAAAYNALGYSLASRNTQLDESFKLISKAMSLAPNDYFIADSMGWVLYRQGKLDKAYEYLSAAYGAQKDPEIAGHLAEVLVKLNRKDDAIKVLEDALVASPNNDVILQSLQKYKK